MARPPAPALAVREGDVDVLRSWARSATVPAGLAPGDGRRSCITAPPRCPSTGYWTNIIHFTYDDTTQTVCTRSRCLG